MKSRLVALNPNDIDNNSGRYTGTSLNTNNKMPESIKIMKPKSPL